MMNLPKVTWRKYLKEAKRRGSDIDRIRRYKIRERAKRLMDDLTLAICGIEKLSKHPEKDFAIIFGNEKRYVELVKALYGGYERSKKQRIRNYMQKDADVALRALLLTDIKFSLERLYEDSRYRRRLVAELATMKVCDTPGAKRVAKLHGIEVFEISVYDAVAGIMTSKYKPQVRIEVIKPSSPQPYVS
jgi:hypothetical protein